ncbi:hypothetical protein FDZ71_01690 [bacterium]|nr:MAG: hypothetical protein FDZ71_01690 [bacterium]
MGQEFDLTMKWGPAPGDNKFIVNGKTMPYLIPEDYNFGSNLKKADKVMISSGMNNKTYYDHTTSVVRAITLTGVAPQMVPAVLAETSWGNEIKVSWAASPSNDVKFYEVYRAIDKAPALTAANLLKATSDLEITDDKVVTGLNYYYTVVAVDYLGLKSMASQSASIKATAGDGPKIASVLVSPAEKPIRAGDIITVTLKGDSNAVGAAYIDGINREFPIIEAKGTGTYTGTYTVTDADMAVERVKHRVYGKLVDDYGKTIYGGSELLFVSIADMNDKTPPTIGAITHDAFAVAGFSGKLVAGDVINVAVEGEKEGFASFKVGNLSEMVKMTEATPGHYTGAYTIKNDDDGDDVAIKVTHSDFVGNVSEKASEETLSIDTRVRMVVTAADTLLPANNASKTRIAVKAQDANGKAVSGHELALSLLTTEEYTGVVGGGMVNDKIATAYDSDDIEVRWGGVTDSFGEISANYTAGFAAKTAVIVAKDITANDVGVGWLNTYVSSTVSIQLIPRLARPGAQINMKLAVTPGWLTADGRSKARVKAWLLDGAGQPLAGELVNFTVAGANGTIRIVNGVTDKNGLAEADYRAGVIAGFVTITAEAKDLGVSRSAQIELRSDAPAKVGLVASVLVLPADGSSTSDITATVTDINDNPNKNTPVLFNVISGEGSVTPADGNTDDAGVVKAVYKAGRTAGNAVVEARCTSREPNEEELRKIYGTIFVPRLYEGQESEKLKIAEWLVAVEDEVQKGQPLVRIQGSKGEYVLTAPAKGIFAKQIRHDRDKVELGDTVGYVQIDKLVWDAEYAK